MWKRHWRRDKMLEKIRDAGEKEKCWRRDTVEKVVEKRRDAREEIH